MLNGNRYSQPAPGWKANQPIHYVSNKVFELSHNMLLINSCLHYDVCPKCPVVHTAEGFAHNTRNWALGGQALGAQGCLVLPTAPVLQQKAGHIVMQQFSEDEWFSAQAKWMPVEMLGRE